jgi:hypothetical protein
MTIHQETRPSRLARLLTVTLAMAAAVWAALLVVQIVFDVVGYLSNQDIVLHLPLDVPLPAEAIAAPGGVVVTEGSATAAQVTVGRLSPDTVGFLLAGTLLARLADLLVLAAVTVVGVLVARGRVLSRSTMPRTILAAVGYAVLAAAGVIVYSFGTWLAMTQLVENAGEPAPYLMLLSSPGSALGGWIVVLLLAVVSLGRRAQRELEGVV